MSFLGLMTVRAHRAVVAGYEAEVRALTTMRDAARASERNLINLSKAGTSSITAYAQEVAELQAELAALRPDAEKHRARVEKAKLNLKQNREKV
jgi:hypothetical protein